MISFLVEMANWPRVLDVRFGPVMTGETWLAPDQAPAPLVDSVVIDFDTVGRCCGIEVLDARLVGPWSAADAGSADEPVPVAHLPARASANDRHRLDEWVGGIVCYGGGGDLHLSLHWESRSGYDYSAELGELDDQGQWIQVGVTSAEVLAGLRFHDPKANLRGLDPGYGSARQRWRERWLRWRRLAPW